MSTGFVMLEFECDEHGRFESLEDRDVCPDVVACPACGSISPWVISAPKLKFPWATVVRGKVEEAPSPYYLNCEPLADGMDQTEFEAQRTKLWEDHRLDQIKKAVS